MSETDMQTVVDDMLAELMREGIADKGDYIDADTGLLMCGKCNTKKQTLVELMGRTMKPSCLCRCRLEELEKEKEKHREKELMEDISRLKSAGLQDNAFFAYIFSNCDETHPCTGYARRYVEHFAEFQKNSQGLLFWGNVGTGKTFLAGCIANALMEKNIPVLMTSFPKLLNALGGLYSSEKNECLQSLKHYALLIIDDLGVERDTPYALETVYRKTIHHHNKPVIKGIAESGRFGAWAHL